MSEVINLSLELKWYAVNGLTQILLGTSQFNNSTQDTIKLINNNFIGSLYIGNDIVIGDSLGSIKCVITSSAPGYESKTVTKAGIIVTPAKQMVNSVTLSGTGAVGTELTATFNISSDLAEPSKNSYVKTPTV